MGKFLIFISGMIFFSSPSHGDAQLYGDLTERHLAPGSDGSAGAVDVTGGKAAAAVVIKYGGSVTGPKSTNTNGAIKICAEAATSARTACLASLSPKIQAAAGMIGVLLGAIGMTKSPSQACEKYGNAMKVAETALMAYNTICTAMQTSCETDCEAAIATLQADSVAISTGLKATVVAGVVPPAIPTDLGMNEQGIVAVNKELVTCKKYKWNLAAAGVGLTNMLKQSAASSSCENKTTVVDCAKDPYNAQCAKAADCSKQDNYQQTYCICQRSPNLPSCPGYSGTNIDVQANGGSGPAGSADKVPTMPGLGNDNSIPVVAAKGGSGGGPGGSGSGGSLSGLGGGGGQAGLAGGKTGGADAKKDKGLNPNILGGYDSGGGGGGSGGSAGRGTASENSAYKAYLPGGQKDPSVSASTYASEVTASGSKTNFQKIREMYSEKQTTFVGN